MRMPPRLLWIHVHSPTQMRLLELRAVLEFNTSCHLPQSAVSATKRFTKLVGFSYFKANIQPRTQLQKVNNSSRGGSSLAAFDIMPMRFMSDRGAVSIFYYSIYDAKLHVQHDQLMQETCRDQFK